MSTATASPSFRRILGDLPARGLPIPAPSGRREQVVAEALAALEKAHVKDRRKAEKTVEQYGLTIEVSRLRDKLARAATTDLQRLLLSTPGIPEALFNKAIERQLAEESDQDDEDVKDASVVTIGEQIESASSSVRGQLEQIADILAKVAETIAGMGGDDRAVGAAAEAGSTVPTSPAAPAAAQAAVEAAPKTRAARGGARKETQS